MVTSIFFFLLVFFSKKFNLFKVIVFLEIFLFLSLFLTMVINTYYYWYMLVLFFFVSEGVFMYCLFIVNNFFMKKNDFF